MEKAVEVAVDSNVVVIGKDTDLIVLLLHHIKPHLKNIYFKPDSKKNADKVWDMKHLKQKLPPQISQNILFLHAWFGCDSVSRIHGFGKGVALTKINNQSFLNAALVFDKVGATEAEIEAAGNQAFLAMYNCKPSDNLSAARYRKYMEKLASSNKRVEPQSLPPTSNAAKYHSHRVYYQISEWKNVHQNLDCTKWGWKLQNNEYVPVTTDLAPAPEELLKIIKCNCTTDCSRTSCSCRKHNLKCSVACGNCKGAACSNCDSIDYDDDLNSNEL